MPSSLPHIRLPNAAFWPLLILSACAPSSRPQADLVATVHPLAAVLREVLPQELRVQTLLPPAASPHTYEPRPSDARCTETARALFYVAPDIDGWAGRMPARVTIATAEWIPQAFALPWEEGAEEEEHGHGHAAVNTHYWGDPLLVQAMLPQFGAELKSLFPEAAPEIARKIEDFSAKLEALDQKLSEMLAPVRGKRVALFHPSLNYFLHRYGIVVVAVVEPYGGKEMSPKYLKGVVDQLRKQDVSAVFTEPQLSRRPAEVVAESGPWPLAELDPIGGAPGRESYEALLLHNAAVLLEALQ